LFNTGNTCLAEVANRQAGYWLHRTPPCCAWGT